jgi:hypothetical protein
VRACGEQEVTSQQLGGRLSIQHLVEHASIERGDEATEHIRKLSLAGRRADKVRVAVVASALVPSREAVEPVLRREHQVIRAGTGWPAATYLDLLDPSGDCRRQVRAAPGVQVASHRHVACEARAEHVIEVAVIEALVQVILQRGKVPEVDDESRACEDAGGKDYLHEEAAAIP